jgi:M3 family oligoendopeptidase
MTFFPRYKMPFVFSNFNGTAGDVDVLTHEIGHAFQGYMSRNILPNEYRDPTMEEAEIHSMSMEFFATPYMEKFFKEDEAKYLFGHLEGAINFLPYGVTVDEFQHWVYAHPTATHEERCQAWRDIEKKYTPYKNYAGFPLYEKGTRWMRQSHIFGAPFYYIDYTLAQVVALQFLGLMKKNHEKAWKKYVKVCKSGGKYPFTELLAFAKLRNPFENGSIKKTFTPVKKVLKAYEENL